MNIRQTLNRLHRSKTDQMLGGVCAGFAEASETPAWIWRAGFLFMVLWLGTGILLYLILWWLMPDDTNSKSR